MKLIQRIETFDGETHEGWAGAKSHLDKLHADLLSKISSNLCAACNGKYVATGNWIDANLDLFLQLHQIKADMALSNPEED